MENTNLSKKERQKFIEVLEQLKENNPDKDTDINNIIAFINDKKYGLVFEKHQEQVDIDLETKIPILVEDKSKEIKCNDDKYNFLIEGDNLHSLKLLEKTYIKNGEGQIDCIYIDPPYNTENKDFKYNDNFISKEDSYRHSKWLSFMKERLELAYNLLKNDGIIFISIDDNELFNLKILCDEIFGEENFITNICVELSKTQGMKVKTAQMGKIVKNHEYILVYGKNIECSSNDRCILYDKANPYDNHFSIIIKETGERTKLIEYLQNEKKYKQEFEKFKLKITQDNIGVLMNLSKTFNDYMLYDIAPILYRTSMIKSDEIQNLAIETNKIIQYDKYLLLKNKNGTIEQLQSYKDTLHYTDDFSPEYCRTTIRGALWKGFYSDMMNVAKEGGIEFKNGKKPIRLIKQLLKWANRPNAIVLDFFAGSGSTGQAVLDLNKEDGGNRYFILCTNNENNICEKVTYSRLTNIKDNYNFNLKYLKCDFIDKQDEELDDKLLDACIPLIELQNRIDIENKKVEVAFCDEDLDNILNKEIKPEVIYIVEDILLSSEQKDIINKNNIEIIDIPNYFYDFM